MKRLVMKFGGTSVGDAEALRRTAGIIQQVQKDVDQVVVVISAMAGMTDQLIDCIHTARDQEFAASGQRVAELHSRVADVLTGLFFGEKPVETIVGIEAKFSELTNLCAQINISGVISPKQYASAVSLGERINVLILSALLRTVGLDSTPVEAAQLIITDRSFYNASPIPVVTHCCINNELGPLLEAGNVPVVTGFIGATRSGEITTLGRGGSDYSAAILARDLNADELWIWKDVDGILTTDPKVLPEAQLVQEITFNETYELAYFGAKVLHPKTLLTARDAGIPIRIMNTFCPQKRGTLISLQAGEGQQPSLKAVTGIEHVFIVSVEGLTGVCQAAITEFVSSFLSAQGREILAAFATAKDHAIHFAIREQLSAEEALSLKTALTGRATTDRVPKVWTWNGKGIVSVIGHTEDDKVQHVDRMLTDAGVDTGSYRCQGSRNSMQFLIPFHQVKKAIQSIHNEVILHAQCK